MLRKEKIKEKLAVLWAYVEEVYQREQQEISQPNFEEISSKKVANTIRKRNEALAEKEKLMEKIKMSVFTIFIFLLINFILS